MLDRRHAAAQVITVMTLPQPKFHLIICAMGGWWWLFQLDMALVAVRMLRTGGQLVLTDFYTPARQAEWERVILQWGPVFTHTVRCEVHKAGTILNPDAK